MSAHDEMPEVNGHNDDFRGRENSCAAADIAHDEGMPSVNRKKKGGNKLSNLFILLLVGGVGLGLIYAVNFGGSAKKQAAVAEEKGVTSNLPPLTMPPPPAPAAPPAPVAAAPAAPGAASQPSGPVQKGPNGKPILDWTDRKLIGTVVVNQQGQQQQRGAAQVQGGRAPDYNQAQGQGQGQGQGGGNNALASRLEPTPMVGVSASLLADRNFIITKGTSLDCALETAIDTTLPGIITCRMTRDVYSDNGQVLLMERGTQLVGEQQGNVKQGQARVFALWTRAKTPNGVIINLNSPGADGLGRSGLDGWVDNHFAERFGAAILMSLIQSSLQVMVENQKDNSGSAILEDTSDQGEGVITKILESTIDIPPTIIKNQGDHINVMVARDLDFSGVYGLEAN
jgi:type IV secretion system protein VirB10